MVFYGLFQCVCVALTKQYLIDDIKDAYSTIISAVCGTTLFGVAKYERS